MLLSILNRAGERFGFRVSALEEPAWAFSSQIVTSAANFATTILVVRIAGLGEFGRFSIAFMTMMIVRNVLVGAVLTPMSSIAPKLAPTSIRAYRGFLLANGIIFGFLTSALIYATFQIVGRYADLPWLNAMSLSLSLVIFTASMADFFRRFQFVVERSARAFIIDLVRFTVQLVMLGLVALGWRQTFDSDAALYCIAVGGISAIGVGMRFYGHAGWNASLSRLLWLRHWNFIKWLVPSMALEVLQSSVPQFAAAAILGESSLGLIKATQQITNILNLPLNALQQILPSLAATKLSKSGYAAMVKFLRKSGYVIALVSVSLGILVVAASPVVAAVLSIDDSSLFRWLLTLFVLLNLVLSLRIPSLILVGAVEDSLANFVATGAGLINSAVLSYILLVSIGEIAVPIIGTMNAILAWTVLTIWAHRKREIYRMTFDG